MTQLRNNTTTGEQSAGNGGAFAPHQRSEANIELPAGATVNLLGQDVEVLAAPFPAELAHLGEPTVSAGWDDFGQLTVYADFPDADSVFVWEDGFGDLRSNLQDDPDLRPAHWTDEDQEDVMEWLRDVRDNVGAPVAQVQYATFNEDRLQQVVNAAVGKPVVNTPAPLTLPVNEHGDVDVSGLNMVQLTRLAHAVSLQLDDQAPTVGANEISFYLGFDDGGDVDERIDDLRVRVGALEAKYGQAKLVEGLAATSSWGRLGDTINEAIYDAELPINALREAINEMENDPPLSAQV